MVSIQRAPVNSHPGYLPKRFYPTFVGQAPGTAAAIPAADVLYLYPFWVPRPVLVVSLHHRIQTGGAGSAIKSGIWANSPVSNKPLGAPLIADNTGQATTSSTATITADTTDKLLGPGWYWAGTKSTGTLPAMWSVPPSNPFCSYFMGFGTATDGIVGSGFSIAATYSSDLPTFAEGASFTAYTGGGIPAVYLGT